MFAIIIKNLEVYLGIYICFGKTWAKIFLLYQN